MPARVTPRASGPAARCNIRRAGKVAMTGMAAPTAGLPVSTLALAPVVNAVIFQ
jgi:hypothetical protein